MPSHGDESAAPELAAAPAREHDDAVNNAGEHELHKSQPLPDEAVEAEPERAAQPTSPPLQAVDPATLNAEPSTSSLPPAASPVPSIAPSLEADREGCEPAKCFGVLLVGFDHALGPTVEFSHPPELNHNEQLLAEHLPFFALPDGAHAVSRLFVRERGARPLTSRRC